MTERKFDEMGNPIDPDVASNKGLKLGICGHETCSYNVGVIWRDVKNNRYVCEACAKDKNRLWGEGTCITERTSALEAAITYDPKTCNIIMGYKGRTVETEPIANAPYIPIKKPERPEGGHAIFIHPDGSIQSSWGLL